MKDAFSALKRWFFRGTRNGGLRTAVNLSRPARVNHSRLDSEACPAQADLLAAEGALRKALRRRNDKTNELAEHNASRGASGDSDTVAHCPVRQRLQYDIEAMDRVIEHLEDRVSSLGAP